MQIHDDSPIIQCGRTITPEEIKQIKETVEFFPNLSRTELVETICEHLNWYTASGTNKIDACMKLLEKMEAAGNLQLPQKQTLIRQKIHSNSVDLTSKTDPQPAISLNLNSLGLVKLEVVKGKESIDLWNEYMTRYHYLGTTRPFGCFLRYFFKCDLGVLGCALFAGPAKSMGERDKWIGWTENQRLKNLSWIANNSRFLILPWVKVKNLASHILGKINRNISRDWYERWGYNPVLLETFVDPIYYHGTCYKAANWKYIGMTTGKGLVRKNKKYTSTPKQIYIIPLTNNFKQTLCSDELKRNVDRRLRN